jgi:hypothetical protein
MPSVERPQVAVPRTARLPVCRCTTRFPAPGSDRVEAVAARRVRGADRGHGAGVMVVCSSITPEASIRIPI